MKKNVIESVVVVNRCIGCGVCAAICPVDILTMRFSTQGIYQPVESDGCLVKCTLCLDVCPFVEENPSEKEIAHTLYANGDDIPFHADLGYFVNTHEVHKDALNDRLLSASGGAGHSILKALLSTNRVNAIISVEANSDPNKLFKFSVFKDVFELHNTCGSVYYPTELSEVIRYVMDHDGDYAVTALPCYAKAIRLAQQKNRKLRIRIKYVIGLVCGQMKTKEFTHEIARNTIGTDRLSSVRYRVKQEDEAANNYAYAFTGENGSVGSVSFKEKPCSPYEMWMSRMFTPMACNNCTDVFSHCADLVIMDAWLPEYIKDYKGHTLVIARNWDIDHALQNARDVTVNSIQYQKVFNSQKAVVASKYYFKHGCNNYLLRRIVQLKVDIQKLSLINHTINSIEITELLKKLNGLEVLSRIISIPNRVVNKLRIWVFGY